MRLFRIILLLLATILVGSAIPGRASVNLKLRLQEFSLPEAVCADDLIIIDGIPTAVLIHWEVISQLTEDVRVHLQVTLETQQGTILEGFSGDFALTMDRLYLTNLDLSDPASPYRLIDVVTGNLLAGIKRTLEHTGFLPTAVYRLRFDLVSDPDGKLLASDQLCLNITNPSTVALATNVGESKLLHTSNPKEPVMGKRFSAAETERIAAALKRILGEKYATIMSDLAKYQPTARLTFNGNPLTVEELEKLAQQFEAGDCKIKALSIR